MGCGSLEPMQFVEIFTASLMMPPIFVGCITRWGCRTARQPGRLHLLEMRRKPTVVRQTTAVLIHCESVTVPFTDGARRFPTACRTNTQAKLTRNEIHKSAMLLAQLAFARVVAPVHKLVFKVLMDAQNF